MCACACTRVFSSDGTNMDNKNFSSIFKSSNHLFIYLLMNRWLFDIVLIWHSRKVMSTCCGERAPFDENFEMGCTTMLIFIELETFSTCKQKGLIRAFSLLQPPPPTLFALPTSGVAAPKSTTSQGSGLFISGSNRFPLSRRFAKENFYEFRRLFTS